MSFDDFAEHVFQKYQLSIAIAVIKSKPPDLTTDEYISHLQNKMADSVNDDDITICSEDFIVEDDFSDNILNNFHDHNFDANSFGKVYDNLIQETNYTKTQNTANIPANFSQTYYDSSQTQYEPNINNKSNTSNLTSQSKTRDIIPMDTEVSVDKTNDKEIHSQENLTLIDTDIDTQKTLLYTVHGFTENCTHYSPSQTEISIPYKYLYGIDKNNPDSNRHDTSNAIDKDTTKTNNNSQNEELMKEINYLDKNINENIQLQKANLTDKTFYTENSHNMNCNSQNWNAFSQNRNEQPVNKTCVTSDYSQNMFQYFNEIQNIKKVYPFTDNNNIILSETNNSKAFTLEQVGNYSQNTTKCTNIDEKKGNIDKENYNIENLTQDFGPNHDESQLNNAEIVPYDIIENEIDAIEVIPYKVLEEFNKVKVYLRRRDKKSSCDAYSSDSGYRSDSQRSSKSALQLSGCTINQSAHCLLNHLMQCSLVAASRQITTEIAETLGQLIDRLHEEESYPPFLEELLDTVDILLRQLYKGQSWEDNEFLKKDEFIQRTILLSQSIHIQKHAIDKITKTLKSFHEKLIDVDVTYELTNIEEVENISYVFHILELLLKKYLKTKKNPSQSCQQSQDDEKIFKKSSITDIWRKKWNSNFKPTEVSRENRCILKECSEILNKIIVDCVSSYSLVAFSALKCFNVMQS